MNRIYEHFFLTTGHYSWQLGFCTCDNIWMISPHSHFHRKITLLCNMHEHSSVLILTMTILYSRMDFSETISLGFQYNFNHCDIILIITIARANDTCYDTYHETFDFSNLLSFNSTVRELGLINLLITIVVTKASFSLKRFELKL